MSNQIKNLIQGWIRKEDLSESLKGSIVRILVELEQNESQHSFILNLLTDKTLVKSYSHPYISAAVVAGILNSNDYPENFDRVHALISPWISSDGDLRDSDHQSEFCSQILPPLTRKYLNLLFDTNSDTNILQELLSCKSFFFSVVTELIKNYHDEDNHSKVKLILEELYQRAFNGTEDSNPINAYFLSSILLVDQELKLSSRSQRIIKNRNVNDSLREINHRISQLSFFLPVVQISGHVLTCILLIIFLKNCSNNSGLKQPLFEKQTSSQTLNSPDITNQPTPPQSVFKEEPSTQTSSPSEKIETPLPKSSISQKKVSLSPTSSPSDTIEQAISNGVKTLLFSDNVRKMVFSINEKTDPSSSLEDLLREQEWEKADVETKRLLFRLNEVDPYKKGDLIKSENMQNCSCLHLLYIEKLWQNASQGKFGFDAQQDILLSIAPDLYENSDNKVTPENYKEFVKRVGWKKGEKWVDPTFTQEAPKGHLPLRGILWDSSMFKNGWYAEGLFPRLRECRHLAQ